MFIYSPTDLSAEDRRLLLANMSVMDTDGDGNISFEVSLPLRCSTVITASFQVVQLAGMQQNQQITSADIDIKNNKSSNNNSNTSIIRSSTIFFLSSNKNNNSRKQCVRSQQKAAVAA